MVLYMEYPHRKLPPGIPPTHPTEPPDLRESVQNLANRVATTADTLSPTSAACLSPHLQGGQQQVPVRVRSSHSTVNISQSAPMQMRSVSLTASQSAVRASPSTPASGGKEIEGILFPSRIISPRPSNQSKRVKWPDLETGEASSQKTKVPKARTRSAVDNLIDSIAAASACCGPMDVTTEFKATDMPQSPLETVYEVERAALSNNLTVRTDLPMVKEPVETPIANDPIMSFREKKLSTIEINGQVESETLSYDSGIESRDEISTTSNEEDWAPVSRPQRPPPIPKTVPLQIQLRNAALMREDERREHQQHEQQHEQERASHVTPRSKQVVQGAVNKGEREKQRPGGPDNFSHLTSRSKQTMQETILHSLPPELTSNQGSRPSRAREGSVKSGTTWTTIHDAPKHGHSKRKSTHSVQTGTSWNVPVSPRRSQATNKGPSPRSKRNGFLRCFPKRREEDTQPRFAEINWKSGGPDVAENPFQSKVVASYGSPTSCESHVSEIAWKSPTGKQVAKMKSSRVEPKPPTGKQASKMKNSRADPEGVYEEGNYEDAGEADVVKGQPNNASEDMPVLTSIPSIRQVKSSDSECNDERYVRSPRAKQIQERTEGRPSTGNRVKGLKPPIV